MTENQKRIAAAAAIATAIAIPAEGLRQYAYRDTGGILTVCYGHTGSDVEKAKQFSLAQCEQLLDADMRNAIAVVDRCAPNLPQNVLAAFSDAVYNMGPKIACDVNRSTAAKYLKAGKYELACKELPKWNKAMIGGNLTALPGLTKRRQQEMAVCLGAN
jgi:lysozyme